MTHDLKISPRFFCEVKNGNKPFELRKNDRNYSTGDYLRLREWDIHELANGSGGYTGRIVTALVTYILYGNGKTLPKKYVILGLRDIWSCPDEPEECYMKMCERCDGCPNEREEYQKCQL